MAILDIVRLTIQAIISEFDLYGYHKYGFNHPLSWYYDFWFVPANININELSLAVASQYLINVDMFTNNACWCIS
jgi:hypothetical protein